MRLALSIFPFFPFPFFLDNISGFLGGFHFNLSVEEEFFFGRSMNEERTGEAEKAGV